jgi:hypothetical protein
MKRGIPLIAPLLSTAIAFNRVCLLGLSLFLCQQTMKDRLVFGHVFDDGSADI